ncbi:MAG: hypothetical protein JKX90_08765 [Colwellia sp.]|nr:hypothetical protein [Colwellia sp.]
MKDREILKIFKVKTDEAFDEMFESLLALLKPHGDLVKLTFNDGQGTLKLVEVDELNPASGEIYTEFKQIVGRCGALVGAAGKTAKRTAIINELIKTKNNGIDVTPAVANNVCKQLLKRGCSKKVLAQHFAEKNRTAAAKSLCFTDKKHKDGLALAMDCLVDQLDSLKMKTRSIRLNHSLDFILKWGFVPIPSKLLLSLFFTQLIDV